MNDTSPKISRKMQEMIQEKSPNERLKMGWSMYYTSKYIITHAILQNNPNISEADLRKELFLKFYGDDFNLLVTKKILHHLDSISQTSHVYTK